MPAQNLSPSSPPEYFLPATPPRSPGYSNQPPLSPTWSNSPPSTPPGFYNDHQSEVIDSADYSRRCRFCTTLFETADELFAHEQSCEFRYT